MALPLALVLGWFALAPSNAYATSALVCPAAELWAKVTPEELASWTEACQDNAFFHAFKGAQLLSLGQTEAAAVALEKALLVNPDLPGAQLDYAQALAQIGLKGSARAILNEVLQRSDIQPSLKEQLTKAQLPAGAITSLPLFQNLQWSTLLQTTYGHESNLNGATYTEALTLYLSNGPVTLGLTDNAKPFSGNAVKSIVAVQGVYRGPGAQELSVSATVNDKTGAAKEGGNSLAAEGALKYNLPMLAGNASGVWQMSATGTQFWLGSLTAYADRGLQLKFNWDSLGAACKWVPGVGQIVQDFAQAITLNGKYTYARMEWQCRKDKNKEIHFGFGGGQDRANNASRPGGNRKRADALMRHEQIVSVPWLASTPGQLSIWMRHSQSKDMEVYSELLGDLKSHTRRSDLGAGYWVPVQKKWSVGVNLEATSQKSNNTLFNLKNSSVYFGIRWAQD
jgi:tetratricopeptide (TPR) repeat protein